MFQNCFLNDVSVSCLSLVGEVNSWNECEKNCRSFHMKPFKLASLSKFHLKCLLRNVQSFMAIQHRYVAKSPSERLGQE